VGKASRRRPSGCDSARAAVHQPFFSSANLSGLDIPAFCNSATPGTQIAPTKNGRPSVHVACFRFAATAQRTSTGSHSRDSGAAAACLGGQTSSPQARGCVCRVRVRSIVRSLQIEFRHECYGKALAFGSQRTLGDLKADSSWAHLLSQLLPGAPTRQ